MVEDFCNEYFSSNMENNINSMIQPVLLSQLGNLPSKDVRNYLFALSQNIETLSKTITNGNIESSNTIIQFNKKSLGAIVKEISISEEVFVNFFRDLAWAPLTALTYDIFADKNDSNFKTQMFTQTTLCFVVMIVMSTMYNIVNTCCINTNQKFTQNKLIKSIFIVLGAGLAIPGWDAMQSWGCPLVQIRLN